MTGMVEMRTTYEPFAGTLTGADGKRYAANDSSRPTVVERRQKTFVYGPKGEGQVPTWDADAERLIWADVPVEEGEGD